MVYKSDFENRVKHELNEKAEEVAPTDEMLREIICRIEDCEGGKDYMLKGRFSNIMTKKFVTVALCGVLAFGGMAFTFSEEVRAATLDQLKSIFILDKSDGEYNITEVTTSEKLFTPICSQTSWLSDEELSAKLGFKVYFPEKLYGDFKYEHKAEAVGIRKVVSAEAMNQLEMNMHMAIKDDDSFKSLSEYDPYRGVFATYIKKDGSTIFINKKAAEDTSEFKYTSYERGNKIIKETKVGKAKAAWLESVYPDYTSIIENGIGKSDIYSKPNGIVTNHSLTWVYDGVEYYLSTYQDFELSMKEAVKIAKSFMDQQ